MILVTQDRVHDLARLARRAPGSDRSTRAGAARRRAGPARRPSAPTVGPQMPAQISTRSHSIAPRSVSTPCTRPSRMSKPVTVTPPSNVTPRADAFAASAVDDPHGLRDAVARHEVRPEDRGRVEQRDLLGGLGRASAASCPSMPYERANPCRRRSSAIRSGVVATSMPPTPYQPGSPSTVERRRTGATCPARSGTSCASRSSGTTRARAHASVEPPGLEQRALVDHQDIGRSELRQVIGGARARRCPRRR